MDIRELIGQHGKSVALVFKNLGIKGPVNSKEVLLATLLHQGVFIDALEKQIEADSKYTSLEGSGTFNSAALLAKIGAGPAPAPVYYPPVGNSFGQTQTMQPVTVTSSKAKAAKKSLWEILGTVAEAAGKFISAKNGTGQTVYVPQAPPAADDTKKTDKNKMFLIGGIGLVVVLLVIFLTQKK